MLSENILTLKYSRFTVGQIPHPSIPVGWYLGQYIDGCMIIVSPRFISLASDQEVNLTSNALSMLPASSPMSYASLGVGCTVCSTSPAMYLSKRTGY